MRSSYKLCLLCWSLLLVAARKRHNDTLKMKSVQPTVILPHQLLHALNQSAVDRENLSDKVDAHMYFIMYGIFLMPLIHRVEYAKSERQLKFLEIGMGCDMTYGPGKSVYMWKKLFGVKADLWVAEFDAACVENARLRNLTLGIRTLVGDQANEIVLKSWLDESGGDFDVIIDDGGHKNHQIMKTFTFLFNKALAPGGLYFIEDLSVGRRGPYYDAKTDIVVSDVLQSWVEQLLIPHWDDYKGTDSAVLRKRERYPLPQSLKWIFCQSEACVIGKCELELLDDSGNCRRPPYFTRHHQSP